MPSNSTKRPGAVSGRAGTLVMKRGKFVMESGAITQGETPANTTTVEIQHARENPPETTARTTAMRHEQARVTKEGQKARVTSQQRAASAAVQLRKATGTEGQEVAMKRHDVPAQGSKVTVGGGQQADPERQEAGAAAQRTSTPREAKRCSENATPGPSKRVKTHKASDGSSRRPKTSSDVLTELLDELRDFNKEVEETHDTAKEMVQTYMEEIMDNTLTRTRALHAYRTLSATISDKSDVEGDRTG